MFSFVVESYERFWGGAIAYERSFSLPRVFGTTPNPVTTVQRNVYYYAYGIPSRRRPLGTPLRANRKSRFLIACPQIITAERNAPAERKGPPSRRARPGLDRSYGRTRFRTIPKNVWFVPSESACKRGFMRVSVGRLHRDVLEFILKLRS